MTLDELPEIMTAADVGAYLQLGRQKAYDLVHAAGGFSVGNGNRLLRLHKDRLIAYLAACRKDQESRPSPVIELATGKISDWPQGTVAEVHYKVCDQGEYWLADSTGSRVAKRKGHYVPDDLLCVGDMGYGDYIIFNVGADGTIAGWTPPTIDPSEWTPVPAPR